MFQAIPQLAWLADDGVMDADQHCDYAAAGTSWVAVDAADRPVGFLSAEPAGDVLHIWEVSVHPDYQGRGAGRALMAAAEAAARAEHMRAMTLTTFRAIAWNAPAYARQGFVILEAGALGARLADILAYEVENGLPAELRCAMEKRLD